MSFIPASFIFINRKTSELLINVNARRPVTSFLYDAGLSFQYLAKEKNDTDPIFPDSLLASLRKNVKLMATMPGRKAITKSVF